jgi:hypothetical protein
MLLPDTSISEGNQGIRLSLTFGSQTPRVSSLPASCATTSPAVTWGGFGLKGPSRVAQGP